MMDAPKFVTMRLGKDSVDDIKKIDACVAGIQEEPLSLTVVCKQVPRTLAAGTYALLWLGSDNSKGMRTEWKQGFRAVARIEAVELGDKHNDDSKTTVSIGYVFPKSMDKNDLLEAYSDAYIHFSEMPLVGLSDYANQTIREVEYGVRSDMGALLSACGMASATSLADLFVVYPDLSALVKQSTFPAAKRLLVTADIHEPRNLIYFGAPGTGKSHDLDALAKMHFDAAHTRRVTFHPDYSYASFVGCYKPTMRYPEQRDDESLLDTVGKPYISYEFVPGPLVRSYVEAMTHPDESYVLVIEEINRANPAAVFGDVFQLLDRGDDGASEYPVSVSEDLGGYLYLKFEHANGGLQGCPEEVSGLYTAQEHRARRVGSMALPPNLYLWATMNSADQGVFPMDTAFKRRWEFRYMGIDAGEDVIAGKVVRLGAEREPVLWNDLRKAVNGLLVKAGVNEDKLMGPFFLRPSVLDDDAAFAEAFKSKVLLYLFEDAAKMRRGKVFSDKAGATYSEICASFDEVGDAVFAMVPVARVAEGVTDGADEGKEV